MVTLAAKYDVKEYVGQFEGPVCPRRFSLLSILVDGVTKNTQSFVIFVQQLNLRPCVKIPPSRIRTV